MLHQDNATSVVCSSRYRSTWLGAYRDATGLRRITSCLFPCRGKLVPVTASGELWRRIGQFQCLLCVVAGAELRLVYRLRGLVADGDWSPSRQSALAFTTNSFSPTCALNASSIFHKPKYPPSAALPAFWPQHQPRDHSISAGLRLALWLPALHG